MYKINNDERYIQSRLTISGFLIIGFMITGIIKPHSLFVSVFLFAVIEIIFLLQKFTTSVAVDELDFIVTYSQFFLKRELKIPKRDVSIKISNEVTFRSPEHLVVYVNVKNKNIYKIDSRDGFDDEDLYKLSQFIPELSNN